MKQKMQGKRIVGLIGKIGSGKTTLSNKFVNKGWFTCAFADKMKDIIADLFLLDRKVLSADNTQLRDLRNKLVIANSMVTCRTLLQEFGNLTRKIDNDVWIKQLRKTIERTPATNIVVSDVRFRNEYQFLASYGTYFIKVVGSTDADDKESQHISETEMDEFPVCDNIVKRDIIEQHFDTILTQVEQHFANRHHF